MSLFIYFVPGTWVALAVLFGIFFIPDKIAAANCILVVLIIATAFSSFVKKYLADL